MPDLRAGHALQASGATGEHAGKVGRDGVIKPGDAVGKKAGDGCGEPMPPERTEERLERLLDHGGKRPRRVLHGGVSRMPCTFTVIFPIQPFSPNAHRGKRKKKVD